MSEQTVGMDNQLPSAKIRTRKPWIYRGISALVLVVVLIAAQRIIHTHTRERPHIDVWFEDVHGLEIGSPLEQGGERIGEVVSMIYDAKLGKRKLRLDLHENEQLLEILCREGTEFYIDHLKTERLQIRGVTRVVHGPSIVARLGDGKKEKKLEFEGVSDLPPDSRLPSSPVRLQVTFATIWGLEKGAPVRELGKDVGLVESVELVEGDRVCVGLAFFSNDSEKCPYTRESTRFYVNHASLSPRGLEGDGSTLLFGAHVVALLDPNSEAARVTSIMGEVGPPPFHLPQSGEMELTLESRQYIPADTPLRYRGELAGYVRGFRRAKDGNGYLIRVRVYSWAQSQITRGSVFSLEPKFKAQLFKDASEVVKLGKILEGKNPVDFRALQGPKFEVPYPDALFRPAIEFRTPPDSGEVIRFSELTEGQFFLYPEPDEEWNHWQASLPNHDLRWSGETPRSVPASMVWRENGVLKFSDVVENGILLPVEGGVLGLKELLEAKVASDRLAKAQLFLDGKEVARGAVNSLSSELRFMRLSQTASNAWKVDRFGKLKESCDLLVCLPSQVRAVDAQRLVREGNRFQLRNSSGFSDAWHGAPALAVNGNEKGKVVGFIRIEKAEERRFAYLCPLEILFE